jgi:hypothetical protein
MFTFFLKIVSHHLPFLSTGKALMMHQQQISRITCLLTVVKFESFKLLLQNLRVSERWNWRLNSYGMSRPFDCPIVTVTEVWRSTLFGSQQSLTLKMEALLSYVMFSAYQLTLIFIKVSLKLRVKLDSCLWRHNVPKKI